MKLTEIKRPKGQFLRTEKEILDKLSDVYNFDAYSFQAGDHDVISDFDISIDGSVDLYFVSGQSLRLPNFEKDGKLVVKFREIRGDVFADYREWKSFDGFPTYVNGNLDIENANVTRYDQLPKKIRQTILARHNKITSLVGVADHFTELVGFDLSLDNIKEGGIGLILVPKLRELMNDGAVISAASWHSTLTWYEIVQKYLGKPDEIFECQNELIDAGYEAYAQL